MGMDHYKQRATDAFHALCTNVRFTEPPCEGGFTRARLFFADGAIESGAGTDEASAFSSALRRS